MIIVSRQISGTHAARAVLEFAEAHDLARSGRLYSETILTVLESASREEAEVIAWRAVKSGYLLSTVARDRLERSGSYTSAQWKAHWQVQTLRERSYRDGEALNEPTRANFVVVTRHRGCSVEVLSTRGFVAPFHALPQDPSRATTMPPRVMERDSNLCQALGSAVSRHPDGHACAQWKTLATAHQTGRCPYPRSGLRQILSPHLGMQNNGSGFKEKGENFQASAWHAEARLGDKLFNKPPSGHEWIPLDGVVWALGDADPLQLWRHLLIQVTRVDGVTPKDPRPRVRHQPVGILAYIEPNGDVGSAEMDYLGKAHNGQVLDRNDQFIGAYDVGRGLVRNSGGSTIAELSKAGAVLGNSQLQAGWVEGFTYDAMQTVAAYLHLVDPEFTASS